ncbi:MAG: Plug domain-containing protein, partial [Gemmatimonadota bacterium]
MIVPLILAVGAALVQSPPLPQDTTRTQRLGDLEVTVARGRDTLARLPMAAAVIRRETITAAQPTIGLDEALTTVPGVHVANRWNFSLDQRLSIRGAGSRANFGVRGVRILLDGVPQTLPDG